MTASASASLQLLLLVAVAAAAAAAASATAVAPSPVTQAASCTDTRVLCQLQSPAAAVINCSAEASAASVASPSSQVASFEQTQPEFLSLMIPAAGSYSLTSLQAVVTCFMLTYQATLRMVAGPTEFRLMPGSLDSLAGLRRLTLRLRFAENRIPGSDVFTARLGARLENLQLESPGVSAIEPAAFQELRSLTRLYISNLKLSHLTGDTLQGLGKLQSLELPGNSLARLDAASFAAAPRLQSVDLRTASAPDQVTVAQDTFCSLRALQLLQYSPSLRTNCSHFASRKISLALSDGADSRTVNCVRLLGEKTPCAAAAAATVAMATTTPPVVTAKVTMTTIGKQGKSTSTAKPTVVGTTSAKKLQTSTSPTSTASFTSTTAASASVSAASPTADGGSTGQPGPGKHATAAASAAGLGPAATAVLTVVVVLAVLVAAVAAFVAHRSRRSVLRRAHSRQPIFSAAAGSSIDMQDSLWNPVFSGGPGGGGGGGSASGVVEEADEA